MTTAEMELLNVLAPREPYVHDPYGGMTKEEFEAREETKREIRKRQRALRELASNPDTPNRAVWCCSRCFVTFSPEATFYMYLDPKTLYASLGCKECFGSLVDAAPIRQVTLVRDVL